MTFEKLTKLFSGGKKPTIGDLIAARQRLAKLRVDLIGKLADLDYCLDSLDEIIARNTVVQEMCSDSEDDDSGGDAY